MLVAMGTDPRGRSGWWGRAACAWAIAFAVAHFYWALGGDVGLGVSAGPLAQERPGWFVALGLWGVGALCLAGALLGRFLARPVLPGPAGRAVTAFGWCACAVLLVRGLAVEVLLLADVAVDIGPEQRTWTLLLWNPWFLIGGLVFGAASWGRAGAASPSRDR
jgi:hypothetical protein